MPVILQLGTIAQCSAPSLVSPSAGHSPDRPRGPRGLLAPTPPATTPAVLVTSSSSPLASPNASVSVSSHHAGGLPLRRLLRRGKSTSEHSARGTANMLMPLWISQCLSSDTTSSSAIRLLSEAVREQLVRGRLATADEYLALGEAALLPPQEGGGKGASADIGSKTARAKKKKEAEKHRRPEEKRKATKNVRRTPSHFQGSLSSVEGTFPVVLTDTGRRSDAGAAEVWCLCCRDAHGDFRYCGRYTLSTDASADGSRPPNLDPTDLAETETSEREPCLTQVPFLVEACVQAHRALSSGHTAAPGEDSDDSHRHVQPLPEFKQGSWRGDSLEVSPALRPAAASLADNASPLLANSLLAGLSASVDETESRGLSRLNSDALDGTGAALSPRLAADARGGALSVSLPSPHTAPPKETSLSARTYPAESTRVSPGLHPASRKPHGREAKTLKFGLLYGVVVPLPVLLMMNSHPTSAEVGSAAPAAPRHRRWHRKDGRSTAHDPNLQPHSPTSPRRRRGEAKRRRTTFALSEVVEIPALLRREPVVTARGRGARKQQSVCVASPSTDSNTHHDSSNDAHRIASETSVPALAMLQPTGNSSLTLVDTGDPEAGGDGRVHSSATLSSDHPLPRSRDAAARLQGSGDMLSTSGANSDPGAAASHQSVAPWLAEEAEARFTLAYEGAQTRLDEAHRQYEAAVACMQRVAMPGLVGADAVPSAVQGSGDEDPLLSLDAGMRRAWAQWAEAWRVPSPRSHRTAVPVGDGDDDDGAITSLPGSRLHTLVRRQLELTAELKECEEAEREGEKLRMLIHIYEQDLAASRERLAELQSAVEAHSEHDAG